VLFCIGLLAAMYFTFLLLDHWFWLSVTAFLTFMYSAPKMAFPMFVKLRRVAIAKTIFLAFAWAHVTTLLPLVISVHPLRPEHIWFVVNRFFYIYAICIIFDFRDVHKDREAGIKSLITLLDEKGVDRLFWFSVLMFVVTIVILLQWITLIQGILLFIPGILVALLYYPSKTNNSDYLYYFVLDGLMMASAPFLILIKFAR
jgi:4-hydroxybenzoate polyprenyltransferase